MAFQERSLSRGDEHRGVETLQRHLIREKEDALPEFGVDRIFGEETENAVQDFQVRYGISNPDGNFYGVAGPATQEKLVEVNVFRNGASGKGVEMLQEALMQFTIDLPQFGADGHYGDETEEGVREFQRHNDLMVDGIAGSETFTTLDKALNTILVESGDTGSVVRMVQSQLLEAGESLPVFGVDGDYGEETENAVRSFQEENNLSVDGMAGPKTMNWLDNETDSPYKQEDLVSFADKQGVVAREMDNDESRYFVDLLKKSDVLNVAFDENESIGNDLATYTINKNDMQLIVVNGYLEEDENVNFGAQFDKDTENLIALTVIRSAGSKYEDEVKIVSYDLESDDSIERDSSWVELENEVLESEVLLAQAIAIYEQNSQDFSAQFLSEADVEAILDFTTCTLIGNMGCQIGCVTSGPYYQLCNLLCTVTLLPLIEKYCPGVPDSVLERI